ncbi:MAG TPA: pentapeptide repeat-containing protein [Streptosporangiaceae bacterium]
MLWPVSNAIAAHDVRTIPAAQRPEQLRLAYATARTMMLQIGGGILAFLAFVYTARNFQLARAAHELSEQGQVTDRYSKAIDQLGSEKPDIRIGGVYALERIAKDSGRDRAAITEVLTAFIRRTARRRDEDDGRQAEPDVKAALLVIARFQSPAPAELDLQGSDLRGLRLTQVRLRGAILTGAVLTGADLSGADLSEARLDNAQLDGADLTGAVLAGARLAGANLRAARLGAADLTAARLERAQLAGASLAGATLTDVTLDHADLTEAQLCRCAATAGASFRETTLTGADLSGARLPGADFREAGLSRARLADATMTGADFRGAVLSEAIFAGCDLTGVELTAMPGRSLDLTGARVAPGARLPRGWQLEPGRPVLRRAERAAPRPS